MDKDKSLKILVACHKPCWLPLEREYVPIHCGRSLSTLSQTDREWMEINTIGDNVGKNISNLNPYFCELTAIYWAWKNYEKLGNPQNIGLCHYRRFLLDSLSDDAIIAPEYVLRRNMTVFEQFCRNHDMNEIVNLRSCIHDEDFGCSFDEYMNSNSGYFFNMFIMKKEVFMEYCETIFPILFKCYESRTWSELDSYQKRMAGFLAERLTGAFIFHYKKKFPELVQTTVCVVPLAESIFWFKIQKRVLKWFASFSWFVTFYSKLLALQTFVNRIRRR